MASHTVHSTQRQRGEGKHTQLHGQGRICRYLKATENETLNFVKRGSYSLKPIEDVKLSLHRIKK